MDLANKSKIQVLRPSIENHSRMMESILLLVSSAFCKHFACMELQKLKEDDQDCFIWNRFHFLRDRLQNFSFAIFLE